MARKHWYIAGAAGYILGLALSGASFKFPHNEGLSRSYDLKYRIFQIEKFQHSLSYDPSNKPSEDISKELLQEEYDRLNSSPEVRKAKDQRNELMMDGIALIVLANIPIGVGIMHKVKKK